MHLGISGSSGSRAQQACAPKAIAKCFSANPHNHVIFHLHSGDVVTFDDPRRFGLMDLLSEAELTAHPVLSKLGREPLSNEFDAVALARVPGEEDSAEGGAARPACRGRNRQHLCVRGTARGAALAVPAGADHCNTGRRAAGDGPSARACDQAGPGSRHRRRDATRAVLPFPGLRPQRPAVSETRLRRRHPAAYASRPLDVLLPALPALASPFSGFSGFARFARFFSQTVTFTTTTVWSSVCSASPRNNCMAEKIADTISFAVAS